MGEGVFSSMSIGGDVSVEVLDELAGLIMPMLDRNNKVWKAADLLKAAAQDSPYLDLSTDESSGVAFYPVTRLCRRRGVPYDWYTAADVDLAAETEWWRRGMPKPIAVRRCADSYLADLADVDQAAEALKAGRADECLEKLQELLNLRPTVMPHFKVSLGKSL